MNIENWPPKYKIRISERARRPFVQLAPNRGLELVIPKRKLKLKKNRNPFQVLQLDLWNRDPISNLNSHDNPHLHSKLNPHVNSKLNPHLDSQSLEGQIDRSIIDSLLQENKTWIQRHLSRWDLEHPQKHTEPMLPNKLNFLGIDKEILIEYQNNPNSMQHRILELENKIIIRGPLQCIASSNECAIETKFSPQSDVQILHEEKIIFVLKRFLHKQAKLHLLPWLARLSLETGLRYSHACIRHQSSLWGSCTAKHKISLNSKLLFLPKQLIEYVILHELCHTVHLNHSKRFWNLLKKFDPFCLQHRKALRASSNYLPRFCERSRPSFAEI